MAPPLREVPTPFFRQMIIRGFRTFDVVVPRNGRRIGIVRSLGLLAIEVFLIEIAALLPDLSTS